jgi:hypothetical protein
MREAMSFEALLEIPQHHRLVQVRSRSRGGLMRGTFWEHEEYDPSGVLIARFSSFEETDPTGCTVRGCKKYDAAGQLVDSAEFGDALQFSAGWRARARSSAYPERQP